MFALSRISSQCCIDLSSSQSLSQCCTEIITAVVDANVIRGFPPSPSAEDRWSGSATSNPALSPYLQKYSSHELGSLDQLPNATILFFFYAAGVLSVLTDDMQISRCAVTSCEAPYKALSPMMNSARILNSIKRGRPYLPWLLF
ncbi:hypothetical protein M011DRAFT_205193 [Sporormia fimetaria CBS 119925]|uniref:Uncharacterized protein n=1 Tax=Sporormia fimetaria CBS 119925 TaxID=1340428 RepID=A0A6A6V2C2_9PLEO|nr:hypothetical protein M011DRAFT_205193 [Sporormia fimetaria CBS 119925]